MGCAMCRLAGPYTGPDAVPVALGQGRQQIKDEVMQETSAIKKKYEKQLREQVKEDLWEMLEPVIQAEMWSELSSAVYTALNHELKPIGEDELRIKAGDALQPIIEAERSMAKMTVQRLIYWPRGLLTRRKIGSERHLMGFIEKIWGENIENLSVKHRLMNKLLADGKASHDRRDVVLMTSEG